MTIDTQIFIACIAVATFGGAAIGYVARDIELSPKLPDWRDTHHSRDSIEQRSRRVQ